MAKLLTLVKDNGLETAFEYCAIALFIALVTLAGTLGSGTPLGILNNVSRLAG